MSLRHVYILYLDYSQTIVTARFNPKSPSHVEINQRHQPPPTPLRQDQLENAHMRFGVRLAEGAKAREHSTVGNGSPGALLSELMGVVPDAFRAWEQGRESKKVKIESFKLGDLRSGEVKVWRVVSREWVGWGRKS